MNKIILAILFTVLFSSSVFAQSPLPKVSPSPSPKPTTDYVLPYPGILPDNALYKIKMLRDRIGAELISDNLRKAEYFLKMGDKRVSASKFLSDYGNSSLAATTASKAEIYLLRSVEMAGRAKNEGRDTGAFLGTLSTASLKHQEVLEEMRLKASDGPKQSFEKSEIVNSDVYKKAQELLK